jgi:hypothetical protein
VFAAAMGALRIFLVYFLAIPADAEISNLGVTDVVVITERRIMHDPERFISKAPLNDKNVISASYSASPDNRSFFWDALIWEFNRIGVVTCRWPYSPVSNNFSVAKADILSPLYIVVSRSVVPCNSLINDFIASRLECGRFSTTVDEINHGLNDLTVSSGNEPHVRWPDPRALIGDKLILDELVGFVSSLESGNSVRMLSPSRFVGVASSHSLFIQLAIENNSGDESKKSCKDDANYRRYFAASSAFVVGMLLWRLIPLSQVALDVVCRRS